MAHGDRRGCRAEALVLERVRNVACSSWRRGRRRLDPVDRLAWAAVRRRSRLPPRGGGSPRFGCPLPRSLDGASRLLGVRDRPVTERGQSPRGPPRAPSLACGPSAAMERSVRAAEVSLRPTPCIFRLCGPTRPASAVLRLSPGT